MFQSDNLKNRHVYSIWFGSFAMSEIRKDCLLSILQNNGCANIHINYRSLAKWIHPDFPIHDIFPNLSPVHQSDYMRAYLLNVYGGGYTDIKRTNNDWSSFFEKLETCNAWGCGYSEISPEGVAPVGGSLELAMKKDYHKLIGFCAMIFKPQTPFTQEWMKRIHKLCDKKYDAAMQHPARHPLDQTGIQFPDGSLSNYPFAWTELGGNIFHPLVFATPERILQIDDIAPCFFNYR